MRKRKEIESLTTYTNPDFNIVDLTTPVIGYSEKLIIELLLDIRDLLEFRSRGGKKRAANLSKKRRKEIATKASHARKVYKDKQK